MVRGLRRRRRRRRRIDPPSTVNIVADASLCERTNNFHLFRPVSSFAFFLHRSSPFSSPFAVIMDHCGEQTQRNVNKKHGGTISRGTRMDESYLSYSPAEENHFRSSCNEVEQVVKTSRSFRLDPEF